MFRLQIYKKNRQMQLFLAFNFIYFYKSHYNLRIDMRTQRQKHIYYIQNTRDEIRFKNPSRVFIFTTSIISYCLP